MQNRLYTTIHTKIKCNFSNEFVSLLGLGRFRWNKAFVDHGKSGKFVSSHICQNELSVLVRWRVRQVHLFEPGIKVFSLSRIALNKGQTKINVK